MADIRQGGDDHVMGIGPRGVYRPEGYERRHEAIPLKKQGWLGNVWWADGPTKTVSCQMCGRTAKVPTMWSDEWLCHTCNPDIQKRGK